MKPYDIELQRPIAMRHDRGVLELRMDALVQPRTAGLDDGPPGSSLRIPVEHARTLALLLKQHLTELDKLQPRSRRSGRA